MSNDLSPSNPLVDPQLLQDEAHAAFMDKAIEKAMDKCELATDDALDVVIECLECNDVRARLSAAQIILNRTLPPRKTRVFRIDIKSIKTINDIVEAKEKVLLKLSRTKINTEEAMNYLSIIDNIKDTLVDAKYIREILKFNEFKKNDASYQAFIKSDVDHHVQ